MSPPSVGEPAPWFSASAMGIPAEAVSFDELAGRHILLVFFGALADAAAGGLVAEFASLASALDKDAAMVVAVSRNRLDALSPPDKSQFLLLLDSDGLTTNLFGVAERGAVAFILSPALQILEIIDAQTSSGFAQTTISRLSKIAVEPSIKRNPPILVAPRIFDAALCDRLIELYDKDGGREIGAIENKGRQVERFDPKFRKRRDYYISDDSVMLQTRQALERRLLPLVYRSFQFATTRIERYLVGCYDARMGGHFRAHRDNTAPIVAHRRFALTINLNNDYDGGDLRFPEFGSDPCRANPGDAIVFSCSLLHEVTPVTRERRYAFLSFLYDERSQQIRDAYLKSSGAAS